MTPTVAVEVPWVGDQRLKTWAKVVTNVDETLATGWAYEGEFVAVGGIQDLPAGSVLLVLGLLSLLRVYRKIRSGFCGLSGTLAELKEDLVWLREWAGSEDASDVTEDAGAAE